MRLGGNQAVYINKTAIQKEEERKNWDKRSI